MNKIKLDGWVIRTPDGEPIAHSFNQDVEMCIIRFVYNLNVSNAIDHEDTGVTPAQIHWKDLRKDGYRVDAITMTGVLDK